MRRGEALLDDLRRRRRKIRGGEVTMFRQALDVVEDSDDPVLVRRPLLERLLRRCVEVLSHARDFFELRGARFLAEVGIAALRPRHSYFYGVRFTIASEERDGRAPDEAVVSGLVCDQFVRQRASFAWIAQPLDVGRHIAIDLVAVVAGVLPALFAD